MQYKAWVSRVLSFADETIQIIVATTDDPEVLEQRLFDSLKVMDYRAHTQMQRLFEDTSLTKELTNKQLNAAREVARRMFPLEPLPSSLDLGTSLEDDSSSSRSTAFEFSKNLHGGEVLKLYIHNFASYDDISAGIKVVWKLIDARLKRTNDRELAVQRYCDKLDFTTRHKVGIVMNLLYGKAFAESVIATLRKEKLDETVEEMRDAVQA